MYNTNPNDIIIGKIKSISIDKKCYNLESSHFGLKNKGFYKDNELIQIKNKIPKNIIGMVVKIKVQYRDIYGILLCKLIENEKGNIKYNFK